MSTVAAPISPQRFAEAIQDLPVGNLHLKAAEIRNSILHLRSSNNQLQNFADEGDCDCLEAIQENRMVMQRMEERISLLRSEVERRGLLWGEEDLDEEVDGESNGNVNMGRQSNGNRGEVDGGQRQRVLDSGRPTSSLGERPGAEEPNE